MKEKTTRKFLKENYHIINIGNQPMQTLFTFEDASYYCTRVEGWLVMAMCLEIMLL